MKDQRSSTILNMTGHAVRLYSEDGSAVDIPPSPQVARCLVEPDHPYGTVHVGGLAVPVVISAVTTAVLNLPDPQPDVLLVVSRMVASAAPHRRDLVFPYDVVRDSNGHPVGCRAFGQVPRPGTLAAPTDHAT